jgi:predicted transcriptional regulator
MRASVGLLRRGLGLRRPSLIRNGLARRAGARLVAQLLAQLLSCRYSERAPVPGVGLLREVLKVRRTFIMTTVRHILDQKGNQVWSLHSGDTVYDAIKTMADKDVGALVVLDGSKIVGIVTERDYARNVFLKGRAATDAGW